LIERISARPTKGSTGKKIRAIGGFRNW